MQSFNTGNRKGLRNQGVNLAGSTEAGKEWLKAALDPFHDTAVDCRGLPDEDNSRVVVQVIKKTVQISAPAGTAGNWAAHVFTAPLMHPMVMRRAQPRYGTFAAYDTTQTVGLGSVQTVVNTMSSGSPDTAFGTVNIHTWDTDVPTFFPSQAANGSTLAAYANPKSVSTLCATAGDSTSLAGLHYLPQYASKQRLVAAGFELHNTTAELYKQGTITVSRVSSDGRIWDRPSVVGSGGLDLITNAGTAALSSPVPTQPTEVVSGPPASLLEALAYAGTKQWAASEGAYVPLVQHVGENKLSYGQMFQFAMVNSDTVWTSDGNPDTGYFTESHIYTSSNKSIRAFAMQYNQLVPFDVSSVILSGLSPQSTFTLECTFIVEVAPHLYDPNLGSLLYSAHPSPKMDRAVLEAYQMVSRLLPPGVPVSMNPAGEFWEMVRSLIARAGPVVAGLLGTIPHPVAQGAATAVGAAAAVAKAMRSKKDTDAKPKAKGGK